MERRFKSAARKESSFRGGGSGARKNQPKWDGDPKVQPKRNTAPGEAVRRFEKFKTNQNGTAF